MSPHVMDHHSHSRSVLTRPLLLSVLELSNRSLHLSLISSSGSEKLIFPFSKIRTKDTNRTHFLQHIVIVTLFKDHPFDTDPPGASAESTL